MSLIAVEGTFVVMMIVLLVVAVITATKLNMSPIQVAPITGEQFIMLVAIVSILLLELYALGSGLDGTAFATSISLIAAISGFYGGKWRAKSSGSV
jgi:hypothetical protein